MIHAALRYGIEGGVVRLEVGADYYHDKVKSVEAENYIIPFVRLNLNLGTDGLCPFFEMDGSVDDNSYRSLTKLNPYLLNPVFGTKSSVDYNGRFGIGGSIWRGKFDYRAYAGFSIRDNHLYWYSADVVQGSDILAAGLTMLPSMARQTVLSFNGEVTWRPASSFRTELGVHGYIYNDDETKLHNGAPAFDGNFPPTTTAARFRSARVSGCKAPVNGPITSWMQHPGRRVSAVSKCPLPPTCGSISTGRFRDALRSSPRAVT